MLSAGLCIGSNNKDNAAGSYLIMRESERNPTCSAGITGVKKKKNWATFILDTAVNKQRSSEQRACRSHKEVPAARRFPDRTWTAEGILDLPLSG